MEISIFIVEELRRKFNHVGDKHLLLELQKVNLLLKDPDVQADGLWVLTVLLSQKC